MVIGVGTVYRVAVDGSKIRETVLGNKELTVSGNRSLITDTAMPAPPLLALALKYQPAKESLPPSSSLAAIVGLSASEQMIWLMTIVAFLGTVVAAMLLFLCFFQREQIRAALRKFKQ